MNWLSSIDNKIMKMFLRGRSRKTERTSPLRDESPKTFNRQARLVHRLPHSFFTLGCDIFLPPNKPPRILRLSIRTLPGRQPPSFTPVTPSLLRPIVLPIPKTSSLRHLTVRSFRAEKFLACSNFGRHPSCLFTIFYRRLLFISTDIPCIL